MRARRKPIARRRLEAVSRLTGYDPERVLLSQCFVHELAGEPSPLLADSVGARCRDLPARGDAPINGGCSPEEVAVLAEEVVSNKIDDLAHRRRFST